MIAQRSLFRVAGVAPALRPSTLSAAPLRMAAVAALARRHASSGVPTETITSEQNLALLNSQRLKRPNSPHLTIYQPQLTWILSGLNRITGVAFSGALYLSAMAFCLHPLVPAIDSAHLIELIHNLPGWFKTSAKFIVALPFTFHSFNSIRHLMWDMNKGLNLKSVYASGYTVLAATVISSIYLAMI